MSRVFNEANVLYGQQPFIHMEIVKKFLFDNVITHNNMYEIMFCKVIFSSCFLEIISFINIHNTSHRLTTFCKSIL